MMKSLGAAVRAIEKARGKLGLPASIQAGFQGTAQAFRASLTNTPLLILAALVTVYILLGVLYESYIHPITILSTLPSAAVGALLSLILFRNDFSVIVIGRDETDDAVKAFKKKHGIRFPIAADPGGVVFSLFAKESIPRTYIISREGKVVFSETGFAGEEHFAQIKTALRRELAK